MICGTLILEIFSTSGRKTRSETMDARATVLEAASKATTKLIAICCDYVPFPIIEANGQVRFEHRSTRLIDFRKSEASLNSGLEERLEAMLTGRKVPSKQFYVMFNDTFFSEQCIDSRNRISSYSFSF